jgi:hypothetical protein
LYWSGLVSDQFFFNHTLFYSFAGAGDSGAVTLQDLIHLLRLRLLHHLPIGSSIEQVRMRIESFFENQQLQTSIQIENTIQHIYDLIL